MKYKGATAGEENISGGALNKISPHLFCNLKTNYNPKKNDEKKKCYR